MSEKDAALQRLYTRLREAIESERLEKGDDYHSLVKTGYNIAIDNVLEILDTSDDETWYEEEL